MRSFLLGLFALALALPAQAGEPINRPRIDDLSWLAGSWVSNENGVRAEEVWLEPAGGLMLGAGRSVSSSQVSFEFLRISPHEGALTLWAAPLGQNPTPFKLKTMTSDEAVFENLAHDAPNVITYRRTGEDAVTAIVEDIDPDTGTKRGYAVGYRRQR